MKFRPMLCLVLALITFYCVYSYHDVSLDSTYEEEIRPVQRHTGDETVQPSIRKKDVLLTYIGHQTDDFHPSVESLNSLVRSFRRHNKEARIVVLLTANYRKGMLKAFLDHFDVETVICRPATYFMNHVQMRFYCERDFLAENLDILRNVFHSDTDVLFQDNIFDSRILQTNGGLVVFEESLSKLVGDSTSNSEWIETCYGPEIRDLMANKTRICAGTIAGEAHAYHRVLDQVLLPQLPRCNDQGAYAVMYHLGMFEAVGVSTRRYLFTEPLVATLNAPAVAFNAWGEVVNRDGLPYAVLHMAKRHPILQRVFELQYPLMSLREQHSCRFQHRLHKCKAPVYGRNFKRDKDVDETTLGLAMREAEKEGWIKDYNDQYLPNASLYERMLLVINEGASDDRDLKKVASPRVQWLSDKLRARARSPIKKRHIMGGKKT